MKTQKSIQRMRGFFHPATLLIASCFMLSQVAHAFEGLDPDTNAPPPPLDSWSFADHTNWTDANGNLPISFTNISWCQLGNGSSLVVETNVPAWLNYEIFETNGTTNIVVNGPGSITFWFGPGWATTNGGPNDWAQLINVGQWTSNSSIGYFGLSTDPSGSNLWFQAQDGLGDSYSLSTPISWTTNYFHFIGLTYSSTNVSLYLDGQLATNDPGGLGIWPDSAVQTNGVFFGSALGGSEQAQGLFNTVQTYNFALDSNDIQQVYDSQNLYFLNPVNIPYMNALSSAPSSPPSGVPSYNDITGAGYLQLVGSASTCVDGSNVDYVWLTNVVAHTAANGTINVTFTIEGGQPNIPYDVFANSVLSFGTNGIPWAWMGQGYQCNIYTLTNLPSTACFLILGTPQDTLGVGLTDAYQLLVTKTNPNNPSAAGDGISNGDKVAMGLNPNTVIPAIPANFTVQTCPQ